jgi:hypothetical protein
MRRRYDANSSWPPFNEGAEPKGDRLFGRWRRTRQKPAVRSLLWGVGIVAFCAGLLFGGSALVQAAHKNPPVPATPRVHLPSSVPSSFVLPDTFALNGGAPCSKLPNQSYQLLTKACHDLSDTGLVVEYDAVSFNMTAPARDIAAQAATSLRQHGWLVGRVGSFEGEGTLSFGRAGWKGEFVFEVTGTSIPNPNLSSSGSNDVAVFAVIRPDA